MSASRAARDRVGQTALYAALALFGTLSLLPLLWMVSASFMAQGEATTFPPALLPHHPTLVHYRDLFGRLALGRYAMNSALVAVVTTAGALAINASAGYAFAKLRFHGRDATFRAMAAGLAIPVQVAMLPLFLLIKSLGLVNSYGGVIIPGLASIFGIFLVRQYALAIPDDLLDAARIDGAGELRVFRSIVLPTIRPVLATLALWTFLATWNDFMWPLIVLSDDRRYTLPVALAGLVGEHSQDVELMMAGAVITVLPVLVLFLMLQRYYVEGVTEGSVK
ncbi:MAG: carbohydrate ABC transporter permease [Gemmatimonadaceae bacterium]|nr:carbohydrate ABC transporter permease [Gemmatimonadaceae bacterium]NUP54201.1 carbohydrate ABC transporter permease [Gemmatimonadaceae bacterium]NUP71688.1 carbohydrate ABC transporter permease [Gemmatimonadaceae bacterium]NUR32768.1 carbohydrate ABC transporter permease [Gemmatimonadaceae bacterium]NUS32586.1 carbohydrate ABC transporter permease [Gemmatimonadaceae bacterium]